MEVENLSSINKYNTRQQREEGKPLRVVYYLTITFIPLTIVSNIFMTNGTYPLMFIGTVYN